MVENSIVYKKAFDFSVRAVKLFKYLEVEKRDYVISKQILKSGTSTGANIKEALYAQSRKDFQHKMNIALKEAAETEYWLELLKETNYITEEMYKSLDSDNSEVIKMLISIIKTIKED